MEFVQFHPTGMVWPPSVRGILVTESVRGDGGVLKNSAGNRFMFDYIPDYFRKETAETEEEADRWYTDKKNNRRPPELLPRDEVARAINSEVKAGRGSPHGGVLLDIASRRDADYIKKRLPSMYHQFRELAEVDITAEAMEVGPTCHYVMGGVEVDPETAAAVVPGLYAAGEVAGGMHGSNRLGGNSLSDLLVFGRRAGAAAARRAQQVTAAPLDERRRPAAATAALAPFERDGGENPYAVQSDLQTVMNDLVGIIRTASEVEQALVRIEELKERARALTVEGHRQYNPGWHLALDLPHMLRVSECIARAALERQESRGGHTRDDFPGPDAEWGRLNVVCTAGRRPHRPAPAGPADDAGRARRDLRGERVSTSMEAAASRDATLRVWRGDAGGGALQDYTVPVNEGEVVLDILHRLQATQAPDLAVRWNCKAGKCGSCSAEVNGRPRLMCLARMGTFPAGRADHDHAAAGVPGHPRPRDGRVVQLREGRADPAVHPAGARRGRQPPDAAGRRRALAGVPQVHRVLPVPGHVPRRARPRGEQACLRRAAVPHADRRARHAPARHRRPPAGRAGRLRARACATSPSAAARSARRASTSRTTR